MNENDNIDEGNLEISSDLSFEVHPATALFPRMDAASFNELKLDILKNGQQIPICVYRNKIVDGRERLQACQELGIEPAFVSVSHVEQPVQSFIVSMNLTRRHLSSSQRSMIAARLTTMKVGDNQHTAQAVPQGDAAAQLDVSIDSVQRAKAVIAGGHGGLITVVESGELDVSNAAILAKLESEKLDEVVKLKAKEMIELAKAEKKAARERWREIKLDQIGVLKAASKPLDPTVGPFNVIYADPPWDYIPADQLGYPTMPLNEICDLLRGKPVVARAAALFLWVPASLIGDGLKVIEAWGFKYRTQAIWAKGGSGMGPYFRVNHEVLLLATRGHTLPEVPPESRDTSVFEFPRRAHSQKPDEFYEVIERMYPEMPKLELFRRGVPRAGWYCWGNEVQAGPAMNHVVVGTTVVEQAPGTMVVNEMLVDAANDAAIEVDVA